MKGYDETLAYLYGLEKFGTHFGLDNVSWILSVLGNPQHALKAVHVGGTNGKGSVCAMLSSMLAAAGYRVGQYTSPHLMSFTERIVVDGRPIDEPELVGLAATMKEEIEKEDVHRFFTFFDFTTALAFSYFRQREVDISVVEVGLGGRLDSTNVINPLLTVITNVGMDHTDQLGNTLAGITREKAGIIKEKTAVVSGVIGEAREIIEEAALQQASPLYTLGGDFDFVRNADQVMDYRGIKRRLPGLYVNLKGDHQLANAALSLCASEVLEEYGFSVPGGAIRDGLAGAEWPGRMEVLRKRPVILLDGAHNPEGMGALKRYIDSHYRCRKILVFGVMRDKDYHTMLREITPGVDTLILTKPQGERALPPQAMTGYMGTAFLTENVRDALVLAKEMSTDDDLILITGSLFTVGEARACIDEIF
jgi:dihydrofolate synthase/folylpolyglutamate synthase